MDPSRALKYSLDGTLSPAEKIPQSNNVILERIVIQDINDENDVIVNSSYIKKEQIADLEEVPHGIIRHAKDKKDYAFPTHRLKKKLESSNKIPLVIVACGSFSPITYLHLRMFEMAMDSINEQTRYEVVGGYFSPVSDYYKKNGLAKSTHRVRMCELLLH